MQLFGIKLANGSRESNYTAAEGARSTSSPWFLQTGLRSPAPPSVGTESCPAATSEPSRQHQAHVEPAREGPHCSSKQTAASALRRTSAALHAFGGARLTSRLIQLPRQSAATEGGERLGARTGCSAWGKALRGGFTPVSLAVHIPIPIPATWQ